MSLCIGIISTWFSGGQETTGEDMDYEKILHLAKGAKGKDDEGYLVEFIRLVEMTRLLPR